MGSSRVPLWLFEALQRTAGPCTGVRNNGAGWRAGFPREGIFAPSGSATLDRRQHRRLRVPFLNTRRPRRGDRHVGATQMSIGNYEHDYQSRPKWCGQACLSSILLLIALNIFVWGETAVNKYGSVSV